MSVRNILSACLSLDGFVVQVHPTTKQHLLLARAVNDIAGHLFT